MLESIRTYFFEKEKKKKLASGKPRSVAFRKDRSNNYGLLLDASQVEIRNTVQKFADSLRHKGNRVSILGLIEGKPEVTAIPFDVITSADLAKLSQVPRSKAAEDFIQQPFDVLINLSLFRDHKALDYIASLSHAAFRIGPWYPHLTNSPYDLCIDTGSSSTLDEWIHELMHTLEKIY